MTTEPSHKTYDGLAGLYAIGGLNRVDRDRFERHMETCRECVEAVMLLLPVSHGLSQATTPQPPPARLRERIVGHEPNPDTALRQRTGSTSSGLAQIGPVYRVVAFVCLVVAASLGWYGAQQVNVARQLRAGLDASSLRIQVADLDAATSRQATAELRARAETLAAPDLVTIVLEGQSEAPAATGTVFLSRERGAVLAVSNIPPLPPGKIYQVWFIIPPNPVGVGFGRVDRDGRIFGTVYPPAESELPIAVAVTLEPEGGVDVPSGDLYLLGRTNREPRPNQ